VIRKLQFGFSLLETLAAVAILLVVTAIVMTGMVQMMNSQGMVANRTEMHAGVRSATELLQQEIGQAGKLSLGSPTANVTLASAVTIPGTVSLSFNTSTSGSTPSSCGNCTVYPGEVLTVDVGANQESVTVAGTSSSPTATFVYAHAAGAPVAALGAFDTGIVPPTTAPYTNGSTGYVLKLYGDLNSDGTMLYVEYTCAPGTATAPGYLYRNEMSITAGSKPAVDNTMILLNNVLNNYDNNNNLLPCFNYQVQALNAGYVVTDVSVTLTVQTQEKDPTTGQFQKETKALLNISPRNVVEVFDTAKLVDSTRAQPMPTTVTTLLP